MPQTGQNSPLRSFREGKNLSLEQLAEQFGVHKTTVMRWEGRRVPAERVAEVERVTGLSRGHLRPDLFRPGMTTQSP
jgi:DNA-binding transcriptional regulator YdaS (Cro superfamily)